LSGGNTPNSSHGLSGDFIYERTNSDEVWLHVLQGSADAAGFTLSFCLVQTIVCDIYRRKASRVTRRRRNDATLNTTLHLTL